MKIAVFLGAQTPKDHIYIEMVEEIGKMIGEKGHTLVFGGSNVGTMKSVSESAKKHGAYVIGVAPEHFKDLASPLCDELKIVPTMGIRKEMMANLSDLFIIAPGGLGTLEEAADVISWKRMGLINGKTVFLDYKGFYSPLKEIFNRMIEEDFIKDSIKNDIFFVEDVKSLEKFM